MNILLSEYCLQIILQHSTRWRDRENVQGGWGHWALNYTGTQCFISGW